jgi:hypothetical protein
MYTLPTVTLVIMPLRTGSPMSSCTSNSSPTPITVITGALLSASGTIATVPCDPPNRLPSLLALGSQLPPRMLQVRVPLHMRSGAGQGS